MPTFTGDNSNNRLTSGTGDDMLVGLGGSDTLDGGAGNDTMLGGAGDDYYFVDSAGDRAVEVVGEGTDAVFASVSFALEDGSEIEALRTTDDAGFANLNLTGNAFGQVISGNAGANMLDGRGGDDYLEGRGGNDTLDGGAGNDVLRGGTGNDYYILDSAADRILEAVGEGSDAAFTSVSFTLEAGSEVEALRITNELGTAALNLTGNEFGQILSGNAGANVLFGGGGDDYLEGRGGNDTLDGGTGNDAMRGGIGSDYYFVDSAGDRILEAVGEGSDVVFTTTSFALEAGSEVEALRAANEAGVVALNLTGNEYGQVLSGNAGVNVLNGGGGDDYLEGRGGDDRLDGGTGNDVLRGGTGNDFYFIDSAGDRILEATGEGSDAAFTSVSFAMEAGSELEALRVADEASTTAINLSGNELAQVLSGNAGANVLSGGGGDDYLEGRGGNDTLDGGTGADAMRGGTGNDYYFIDNAGDRVLEAGGEGSDALFASVSFTLEAGSEVEALRTADDAAVTSINLTGNEYGQVLSGNDGANVLNGGGGDDYIEGRWGNDTLIGGTGTDVLIGGLGNDTYVVDASGDRAIEYAGQGSDSVLASTSFALEQGSEIEALGTTDAAGVAAINLTGNELSQQIVGNAGANLLSGGAGNDTLIGNAGNDVLVGGTGADSLSGGIGDDRLEGGQDNDTLTGGAGADQFVFSDLSAGNIDTIVDFDVSTDRIVLDGNIGSQFFYFATGGLSAAAFGTGTTATTDLQHIVYDSATGIISFDIDGLGGMDAIQFAKVAPGTALTASQFTVSGEADHLPVFVSGNAVTVADHTATTAVVYPAGATDADNDWIDYVLAGPDAGLFSIDGSGQVRFISSPDYATRSSYSFSVGAVETNGSTVYQAVTVTVNFGPSASAYIINEGSAANDTTGQAVVLDRALFRVSPNNYDLPDASLPSATINGSISPSGDHDFYRVTLQAGEQIILDIDGTTGLDSVVRLYNSSGVEIAMNDDAVAFDPGSGAHSGVSHNLDSLIRYRVPTAGTYYFSVESYSDSTGPTSSGSYTLNVSVAPPASAAQLVEEDIQALLSGSSWGSTNLTFGFPTLASQYPNGEATDEISTFQPLLTAQSNAVRQILTYAASLTNLVFTENSLNPGLAQMRFARTANIDTAHAYYPATGSGGDSWYNSAGGSYDNPIVGNYGWATFLHETGHALGLKHGHEAPALSFIHDTLEYSVMTYRSYQGATVDDTSGYTNEQFGYPQTYMMYDIAALQRLYGADFGNNSGDSVYTWNANSGAFMINGVVQWTPGANRVFMTIWDGGGIDTYDMSNLPASSGVSIDLRPGEWSTTSPVQLANLGDGNFAIGNVANALQYNGDIRSLIENAIGTAGNDVITGNDAVNVLSGRDGYDVFRFMSVAQSPTSAVDTITDFSSVDLLDFSAIDANTGTSTNDAFQFLGTGAFSGHAGEIRYDHIGNDVIVYADVNGDGIPDLQVHLQNLSTISNSNFVL